MINKDNVIIKKANVGIFLSGSLTSTASACSRQFSFDYKQLAKEVVSQMGCVTEEMSGKMAKEVTARLEKRRTGDLEMLMTAMMVNQLAAALTATTTMTATTLLARAVEGGLRYLLAHQNKEAPTTKERWQP